MRPRKKEVDAVAALLMEEAPDVDTLAVRVIEALDAARADRTYYTVGQTAHGVSWCWGWYSTPGQAQKAVEKGTVPVLTGARAGVLPIYREPVEEDHKAAPCVCGHPRIVHDWPRLKTKRGCVINGCDCTADGRAA